MMRYKVFLFIILVSMVFLHSQEDDSADSSSLDVPPPIEKPNSSEDWQSEKDIINYGLEHEIISLIKELKEKEQDDLNEELIKLFNETRLSPIRVAILDFFGSIKAPVLNEEVLKRLETIEDYKTSESKSLLYYVAQNKMESAKPFLHSIIERKTEEYLVEALDALGKIGDEDDGAFLIDYYENIDVDDEKKEDIIKEAILKALDGISPPESLDFFLNIIEDAGEGIMIRSFAILALSNIKNDDVLQKLISIYSSSSEPHIRLYSIKALSKFEGEETKKVIAEALRDSYYKVRLEAINSIAEGDEKTVEYLLYRAKKDPELSIKLVAIEKLTSLHSAKANEELVKMFNSDNVGTSIRVKIADGLLKNEFDIIFADVERVSIESTKSEKDKIFRQELGKVIAKIKNERTSNIAQSYLMASDVLTKTLGLDMFSTNRYSSLLPIIKEMSQDKKMGALQKRALFLLGEEADSTASE